VGFGSVQDAAVAIQSPEEITTLLGHSEGASIIAIQVLGINTLKTVMPSPEFLQLGSKIVNSQCHDRLVRIETEGYCLLIDLQRVGRVSRIAKAERWEMASRSPQPTMIVFLSDGSGYEFREASKTKRITLSIGFEKST
jgi:hypothetical protein